METSLEVLNKTQRVTPPDALYNKIMESISDRADIKKYMLLLSALLY